MEINSKSDIKLILKEFKKTALGKNAIENNYNDNDLVEMYSKKVMIEKINNKKNDLIKSKNIDNILKNTKQRYVNCWDCELCK